MITIKKPIIILLITTLLILIGCNNQEIPQELKCNSDSDCVPASCCHPSSCVNINFKPDCTGIRCTMECAPETMDCGQGSCVCKNNKCEAVIN